MSGAAPATGQALNPRKVNVLKRTCSYSEKRQNLGKGRNKQKLDVDWQEPVCRNLGIGYLPPKSFARVYFGSQVLFRRSPGTPSPQQNPCTQVTEIPLFWMVYLAENGGTCPQVQGSISHLAEAVQREASLEGSLFNRRFFQQDWGPHTLCCSECTVFELETQVIPPGSTCPFDGPIEIIGPQCCGKIATICALQSALLRGRLC